MLAVTSPDMGIWSVVFQLVVLLAVALLLGMLFERLRQSAILGYLLAGTVMGPNVLNMVDADSGLPIMAELGVSLLLFAIGLEFSIRRLVRLGSIAVGGGSLQVLGTLAVAAAVSTWMGLDLRTAVAAGAVVALSSTACVLRILFDRAELDSLHGRDAIGILLLQDVAVVPLVLLVTLLGGDGSVAEMGLQFTKAVGLIAGLVGAFYLFSNHVLPRVLATLSLSRDRELLLLLAVVLALGSACASHALHISPALGAFIAGIMLAESPFATQIRSDISALRVLFITLFFASVGMLADPRWILENAGHVSLVVGLLIVGKAAIIAGIALLFGRPLYLAIATGVCLAQVGEFGVVIAGIAHTGGVMADQHFRLLVSATLITLFVTPFLVRRALPFGRMLRRLIPTRKGFPAPAADDGGGPGEGQTAHVILAGFGPSGQRVGEELLRQKTDALVLDFRPANIELAQSMGLKGAVGDASNLEVLVHHGITRAKAIVITVPDYRAAEQIVASVRTLAPRIDIVVRARYHGFVSELERSGATVVIDEEEHTGRRMAAALRALLAGAES